MRVKLNHRVGILFCSLNVLLAALNSVYANHLTSVDLSPTNTVIGCEQLNGWSHVIKPDLRYLKQHEISDYCPTAKLNTCEKNTEISVVLLKKIIDWHQQHTNGIEVDLSSFSLSFNDITHLTFDLRVNGDKSTVIPPKQAKQKARIFLTQVNSEHGNGRVINQDKLNQAIDELIDDNAHIRIVFYGEDHANVEKPTNYATFTLHRSLSNTENIENIETVAVKNQRLSYYQSVNYQETDTTKEEIGSKKIKGILITAESKNGKVLRNYYPNEINHFLQKMNNRSNLLLYNNQSKFPLSLDAINEISVAIKNIQFQH